MIADCRNPCWVIVVLRRTLSNTFFCWQHETVCYGFGTNFAPFGTLFWESNRICMEEDQWTCVGWLLPGELVPGLWRYIVWFSFLLLEELGSQCVREQKYHLSCWFHFLYTWNTEKYLLEMDRRYCRSSSGGSGSLCLQYQRALRLWTGVYRSVMQKLKVWENCWAP